MGGATPLYLTVGFILEEGLPLADLARIVRSLAHAAREAGVAVITGDTKVVEQGKGDGVFITTTGIGVVPDGVNLSGHLAQPGDAVLVSGMLGDHGVAILSQREGLAFAADVVSDSAALHHPGRPKLIAACPSLRLMRDSGRPGHHAERNRRAIRRGHSSGRSGDSGAPGGRAACEFWGWIRCTAPTKAGSPPSAPPPTPRRCWPPCAPTRWARRSHHRRGDCRPALLCPRPHPFGGERLVDWLNGEMLPRIC